MSERITIVLIDDDELVHKLVGRVLRGVPCQFTPFSEPDACLAWLQQGAPDHLWVDMRMPGCDGVTFLRRYRECCPDAATRVVLCSSVEITRESQAIAHQLGAVVQLKDELLDSVRLRRLLDGAAARPDGAPLA